MALIVRKIPDVFAAALAASFNLWKKEVAAQLTTLPHADITSTSSGEYLNPVSTPDLVAAPTATDLPSTIALSNDCRATANRHLTDADAHKVADSTVGAPAATDLPSVETLLNAIKAKCISHADDTSVHYTADDTNAITSPDATDLASAETLANELKTFLNAHIQFGFTAPSLHVVDA